jgi:diguanylate cyclase (GGDEF)-like protein/PAS domain S-box-containing protein
MYTDNIIFKNKLFEFFVEKVADAIFIHDFSGKFIEVNQQACDSLGYTKDELLSMTVMNVQKNFNLQTAQEEWKNIKPNERHTLLGYQCRKDGSIFPVEVHFSCINFDGEKIFLSLVQNISERKKLEEALKESKKKFSIIFKETALPIALTKLPNHEYIDVNNTWCKLFAYKKEELIGKTSAELGISRDLNIQNNMVDILKTDYKLCKYETILYTKSGSLLNVLVDVSIVTIDDIEYAISTINDITERVYWEMALKESEEKYRTLFEDSLDMIHIIDMNGIIIDANTKEIEVLGYGKELIGKKLFDLIDPSYQQITKEKFKHVFKGEEIKQYETVMLTKDNRKLTVEVSVTPHMRNGELLSAHAILRDVTSRKYIEEKLIENEEKYRALFEDSLDMIHIVDSNGHIIDANAAQMKTLGYSKEELRNMRIIDMIAPEDRENARLRIAQIRNAELIGVYESILLTKDGRKIYMEARSTPHVVDGKMVFTHTIIRDITERKAKEAKLNEAAIVVENLSEGLLITDENTYILSVNPAFTKLTGFTKEEAVGKKTNILRSGLQSDNFYKEMWECLNSKGFWKGELWNHRRNGEEYFERVDIRSIKDKTGKVQNYIGLFSDITIMKKHQSELEYMAHYDQLTNLPNRILLTDRLSQALILTARRKNIVAIVFIDLDGFKNINDTFGHDIGDKVLIEISHRMKRILRVGDTLSRIGGDEFLAIFVDLVEKKEVEYILQRLLDCACKPFLIDNNLMQISASIGVSFSPYDGIETDLLIRQADQAMYQSKQNGKNCYHFFDLKKDNLLKNYNKDLLRIKEALENSEFVLYYQPKVNMKHGTIIGVEALIRWQHPEYGLLVPSEFLPIINNHHICIEIGEWVLKTALNQCEIWKTQGLAINIAVNIDALHLQQEDFLSRLKQILNLYPTFDPHCLELEVLETSAMYDIAQVSKLINECFSFGVKFALDDFGTGYSSLTYLRRLPAQLIKIDQTFVQDMLIDLNDLAIIEGVISLAKAFKRNVIAEGVETVEHGYALLQLGCELGQGYGISPPIPASEILEWTNKWKTDESWIKISRLKNN